MEHLDLTASWAGFAALAVFFVAYVLVISEEFTHLRKSKPVVLAADAVVVGTGRAGAETEARHERELHDEDDLAHGERLRAECMSPAPTSPARRGPSRRDTPCGS